MLPNKVSPEQIQDIMKNRVTITIRHETEPTKLVRAEAWLDGSYLLADAVSKAVDPANFDAQKGIDYSTEDALKRAEDKLWELEGYALYNLLNAANNSNYVTRLQQEVNETEERVEKLRAFIMKSKPSNLDEEDWADLQRQYHHQSQYLTIIQKRLQKALSK